MRRMKTRLDAFKAKNPGFQFPRPPPPVPGPIGGTVDGTSEQPIHDSPGGNEPAPKADIDWTTEWNNAGTDLPAPKPWEIPGGSGSGSSGLPGAPGTEEFRPGEIEIFPEHPIPIEPPPFFHGEKMKRARRGQGFGPRRG